MAEKFINPYNFINFPAQKAKAYTDTDRHTGVIKYSITTESPLFIPNSSSESAFSESTKVENHKSYDFFSYTELEAGKTYENEYHIPVIPGSEMRGVVRNVYETLTDSCMGVLNSEEYPVKRAPVRFKPALLCRNKEGMFELRDAFSTPVGDKAFNGKSPMEYNNWRNGDLIVGKGYLLKWGMGGTGSKAKKRYHAFSEKSARAGEGRYKKNIVLSRDDVERKLFPVISSYLSQPALQKNNKDAYIEYRKDLENFFKDKKKQYFPVNYSTVGKNLVYLSPATVTKEAFHNSLGMLAGEFASCTENFCPACELFGHIGKNGDSSGSKIRFTDLYVTDKRRPEEYYEFNKITLQALGGPKLGNTEFYLKQPDGATFWTYDYQVVDGKVIAKPGELRGRKFYWHSRNSRILKAEPSNFNKTVRPVTGKVTFSGDLYFEEISKKQLNQLVWILNSGKENLGLKLGSAKPLGMGSIVCKVLEVKERRIALKDGKLEYKVSPLTTALTYEQAGLSVHAKKEFYKIAGLDSVPENMEISYPKDIAQKNKAIEKGYEWFVRNRGTNSGKKFASEREDIKIYANLPNILDTDLGMAYSGKKWQNNGKNNDRKGNQ